MPIGLVDLVRAVRLAEQLRSVRLRGEHLERIKRLVSECPDPVPAELAARIETLARKPT